MGILMRGGEVAGQTRVELDKALSDPSPYVRVVAAETLGRYHNRAEQVLPLLLELADCEKHGVYVSLAALNVIDGLSLIAKPPLARIKALPRKDPRAPERMQEYVPRLIEKIAADFD